MAETIKATLPLGDVSTWRTATVKIGKGSANAPSNDTVLPAGYPVFESSVSGQEYDAFTKTGIAAVIVDTLGTSGTSVTTPKKAIGILLEPWTVSATQTDVKIAYAGEFYMDAIYDRCGSTLLPVATVTKKMLKNAAGHIVFTDRADAEIYS